MPALATKTNSRSVDASRIDAGESPGDRQYGLGDFVATVAAAEDPRTGEIANERLCNLYKSRPRSWDTTEHRLALGITSGITGGYTVPVSLQTMLLKAVSAKAIVRPRALPVKMTTLQVDLPVFDEETAQAVNTPVWFGGISPSWLPVDGTWPANEPKLRSATLTARLLGAAFDVSNSLLQSAAESLDVILADAIAGAVAWAEDKAFLRGSGIAEPLGVTASPALLVTSARAGASGITFADTRKLSSRLPDFSRDHGYPTWIVSQNALDDLEAAAGESDSVFGRVTTQVVEEVDPVTGQIRLKGHQFLSGYELLTSSKLPTLNTVGDLLLCDFSQYVVGDLLSLEIMAGTTGPGFINNLTTFRLVHMVAGLPRFAAPLTTEDSTGTSTVSPFVALGAGT
jgi:HK97 family phage major capsid protein